MYDYLELLESALDSLPDAIALLDRDGSVVFWNQAAEAITGYSPAEVEPQMPASLARLDRGADVTGASVLVRTRHKLGHEVPAIARQFTLRDGLGENLGTIVQFHPAERLDALPHGNTGGDDDLQTSQEDFEERLRAEYEDFQRGGQPFGLLWIGVDQGPELGRTHGDGAFHAMLGKVQHALASGLRPAEELARWGENEFLVIAHERTAEMLATRARLLAGLARTADFRWWGDRISLTTSIGAVQAVHSRSEGLPELLNRARELMEASNRDGGNRVTCTHLLDEGGVSAEESACMPS